MWPHLTFLDPYIKLKTTKLPVIFTIALKLSLLKTFVQNQLSSPKKNRHLLIPLNEEEDEGFVWEKGLHGEWGKWGHLYCRGDLKVKISHCEFWSKWVDENLMLENGS